MHSDQFFVLLRGLQTDKNMGSATLKQLINEKVTRYSSFFAMNVGIESLS
jgi:hypothetical protein